MYEGMLGPRSIGARKRMLMSITRVRPNEWVSEVSESHSVVSDSLWPHGLYSPWNSPGQNTFLSLLQGIFPTQGLNPGLLHYSRILYQLSHQGSPRIPERVAYPFSRESSQPNNRTGVSGIAGEFFTNWVIREALYEVGIWKQESL